MIPLPYSQQDFNGGDYACTGVALSAAICCLQSGGLPVESMVRQVCVWARLCVCVCVFVRLCVGAWVRVWLWVRA